MRGDLTDEEWAIIGGLLPAERGRWARPAPGQTGAFSMACFMCCGPAAPGGTCTSATASGTRSTSASRRFEPARVWDALLETLVELGLTDDWQHMLDSTTVRGGCAAGAEDAGFGRSRGGFTARSTPVRTVRNAAGFKLTGGEASDYRAVAELMALPLAKPRLLLADKGYDSDAVREGLPCPTASCPVVPPRANRSTHRLRLSPLQGSQPHRAHVQPSQAVPPHRNPLRRRRSPPRLPPSGRCQAMVLLRFVQQASGGIWSVVSTGGSRNSCRHETSSLGCELSDDATAATAVSVRP